MELLAPAGSMESLRAAVYAGADAVYLGGKMFNARQGAANFTFEELSEAVQLAHDYNVRIYVTVNTLTHEDELNPMTDYLCELAHRQVDAFIIQDLGVARLAKEIAPNVELHASTQMTIHAAEALPFLIDNGFTRVVLAREVSITRVAEMHQQYPQLGLEVFAHGALCYAYSGQCLMSSIIGGRSGNRGACAGPCRLPYTLLCDDKEVKTQGEYLMSPRDLCLIDDLSALRDAGAAAIKIEGRLKRPEYVYTVVSHYRRALDYGGNSANSDVKADLLQAFNRGFTRGLIFGESGPKLMGISQPDNRGVQVAEAIDSQRGKMRVKALTDITKGDILAWRSNDKTYTMKIDNSYVKNKLFEIKVNDPVLKKTAINRVVSDNQQKIAAEALRRPVAKFGLELLVKLRVGYNIELVGIAEDGLTCTIRGNEPLEKARNRVANSEYVCSQLNRLGGTIWYLKHCEVEIVDDPAVSAAELNDCRRRLIEELTALRREQFAKNPLDFDQCKHRANEVLSRSTKQGKPPKTEIQLAVAVDSLPAAQTALSAGADLIYYGHAESNMPVDYQMQSAFALAGNKLVWRWPRITPSATLAALHTKLQQYLTYGLKHIMVDNIGQLELLSSRDDIELVSGSGLPVFNHLTAQVLMDNNVKRLTLSPELNNKQIAQLCSEIALPTELIVHGKLLLMVHESCIVKGAGVCQKGKCSKHKWSLRDRKGYQFPITFDQEHRSYLYNSQDLALFDRLAEIVKMQPAVIRLECGGYDAEYIRQVTTVYRQLLDEMYQGNYPNYQDASILLQDLAADGLTRGHWQRGV